MLIGLPLARGWAGPARVPPALSALRAELLEVEVPLDPAHDLVRDLPDIAHADDLLPLGIDHRSPDLAVLQELLLGLVAGRVLRHLDVLRPVRIRLAQLLDQRAVLRLLALELPD